jgi:hypothetical protein
MTDGGSDRFHAIVLDWLKSEPFHRDAVRVLAVTGDGSDWNGDTEGGFYSSFGAGIQFEDDKGRLRSIHVSGSDMEDLWMHVVRSVQ